MKQRIEQLLRITLQELQVSGVFPAIPAFIQIENTKDKRHGDFASNIAFILGSSLQEDPLQIAKQIVNLFPDSPLIQKIEIGGAGFINFFLSDDALNDVIRTILLEKENYGRSKMGRSKKVLVEFVSADPILPLRVTHGRQAAFGSVVANLLDAVGFDIYREYYSNDMGRLMDILTISVWLRYLEKLGDTVTYPAKGLKEKWVESLADQAMLTFGDALKRSLPEIVTNLPPDEPQGGDKEQYMDVLIDQVKKHLADQYDTLQTFLADKTLVDIRNDLAEFGVNYDNWFSEKQLVNEGAIAKFVAKLEHHPHVYERDGAVWFRTTDFGDDKDRMLVQSDGSYTYFARDAAYHLNKFERGFDIGLDIFRMGQQGYITRMKAIVETFGINPERLIQLNIQTAMLDAEPQSKELTLRELRNTLGNDAARFSYLLRKAEQPMHVNLALAKSHSLENPVYYVQYAYARVDHVFKALEAQGHQYNEAEGLAHLHELSALSERQLLNTLSRYPDMIIEAALHYEPYLLALYMRDLAADFHAYYQSQLILVEDATLRNARLALVKAVRQTLLNGFNILGIKAREMMSFA